MNKRVRKPLSPFGLNTNEAAKFLSVSEAFMRKMRAEGTGPNYSKIGSKKVVYPVTELKKYLKDNLVRQT